MADFLYNNGSMSLWNEQTGLLTDTIKVMLVASGYSADPDDDFVDEAGANDPVDHEISGGSGYTGGFGGAGRKTLGSKTITVDKANDRADFDAADVTWSAIDTTTEPAQLLVIKEITDDTATILISKHDFVVVTNGGDVTAQINDLIRLSTV